MNIKIICQKIPKLNKDSQYPIFLMKSIALFLTTV
jgi:hypothetical protein